MAHIHKVYDTDTHFQLDSVRKELKIAEGYEKVKVIQNDHNSERFTFELPRYIEGHDMSICNKVEVHYLNVDTQTKEESRGVYSVDDLQISPEDRDKVICSWLISHNATKYVGSLFFVLRFECNTGDNIDYVLNTLIYEGIYVGKGIYNSETVITEYADVLEAWRLEIFGAKDGVIKFIEEETQKVINTIPEEYTEMSNKVDYLYDNVANAIKGNVSGSVVAIDDVSPVKHKPIVRVHGKNLWNMLAITSTNNFTVNSNWTITVNGGKFYCPTNQTLSMICPSLKVGDVVTLSINTDGANYIYLSGASGVGVGNKKTLTITEDMLSSIVIIYGVEESEADYNESHTIYSIQLEHGNMITDYIPYIDPTTITVTDGNGKTYVPNEDGTVEGLLSTSPAMTLTTDTDGIIVDCEYIKDSNVVINKLINAIVALGGSV